MKNTGESIEKNNQKEQSANKELDKYIDHVVERMKLEKQQEEIDNLLGPDGESSLSKEKDQILKEHRQNQRRFEYDYEEDFYEPIYDDRD